MKPTLAFCLLLILWTQDASAQRLDGLELQLYPAGFIATYRTEWPVGRRASLLAFAGLNATDRRNWGRHDDEAGAGPGIGGAWQRWLEPDRDRFFVGGRLDAWLLSIEWLDDGARSGDTDVLVLQPTVRGGFSHRWRSLRIDLTAALGAEINAWTNDENVGEGAILLVGIGASF